MKPKLYEFQRVYNLRDKDIIDMFNRGIPVSTIAYAVSISRRLNKPKALEVSRRIISDYFRNGQGRFKYEQTRLFY